MKRVFVYLRPRIPRMFFGITLKFVGTIMDLFLPMLLAYMIDDVAQHVKASGDYGELIIVGVLMLVCAVVAVLGNVFANQIAAGVARDFTKALRHDLFTKITALSCRQIDSFSVSSLEARMTTDTYHLHHMVGMMQRIGIRAPLLLIGGICVTMSMNPRLTMVLIFVLPFMAASAYIISKKGLPLFASQQRAVDGLVKVIRENITGIRVIKALSKTDYETERFDKYSKNLVECETKASLTMALTNPLMNFLLNTGLAAVILVGAAGVRQGTCEVGTIVAFLSYFTIILNAMLSITRIFTNFTKGMASAGRISEILDADDDFILTENKAIESDAYIEFKNVSFSYYKKRNNVENISFALKKGGSLGVIGATGSGKSTVISLLMRLYDTDSGEIIIGGRNIRSIPEGELHRMFGVAFQSDVLFADTIRNNIDFGRNLTDDAIKRAIRISQAEEFINSLPEGLGHMLTVRGSNLSGGQRQRVVLARALAGDPDILVLDDSSSALDYKTDSRFRQMLASEGIKSTKVIIAQRVSSVKDCDVIMVLDEGGVIGIGTHEELLKSCGVYSQTASLQMGGNAVGKEK